MYSILLAVGTISGFKMPCLNKWESISEIFMCLRGSDTEGT